LEAATELHKDTVADQSWATIGGYASLAKQKVRLIPLGGLGEIGKNMMVVEYQEDIIIIDVGLMFPDDEMFGVDLVIPDVSYLADKLDRIRGILITHGHEDHAGALPYILPALHFPPVYATRLTQGLISIKLKERRILDQATLHVVAPGDIITLGDCQAEFYRVNHSIPDATGVILRTPAGTIIHTGDYKFDHTPVDGLLTDFGLLARTGQEGVLALLGDSTRVEVPGYTPSERAITDTFDQLFATAPGRVIVATFASHISRVQQLLEIAEGYNRRVALVGRSMLNNVHMAIELGYLTVPDGLIIRAEDIHRYDPEQILILCTGSQGEPTSALTRIANRDHRLIQIEPGDVVVLSATPIPGNEKQVNRTINNLSKQGAEVLHQGVANVHVSGHASQEELKLMLSLLRPQFFMPIHGEYRQLIRHKKLAESVGIPDMNILVAEDGDVVEVTPESIRKVNHVTCGNVYVDGLGVGDVGQVVLRDRQVLAQDGILMTILTVDKETGHPVAGPDIISRGFVYMREAEDLIERAREYVTASLDSQNGNHADWSFVKGKIKDTLSEFLYAQTKRRPMIIPVVVEV
jgi:ribonuclease J